MANYSSWRSVATSLTISKKWRRATNAEARLWLGLLLTSDTYGCADADPDRLLLTALPGLQGWDEDRVTEALQGLADCGLVQLYEAEDRTWVQLTAYDEHQPSEALRKRGRRRTPPPPEDASAGVGRTMTPPKRKRKRKGEGDIEGISKDICALGPKPKTPLEAPNAKTLQVYEAWKEQQAATGGLVPRKLTADRRKKIETRLKDGYSPEQLIESISGFMNDSWHLGKNDRNTRYTDITTLLKNPTKVDAGLELARKTSAKTETTNEHRSRYVRPVS